MLPPVSSMLNFMLYALLFLHPQLYLKNSMTTKGDIRTILFLNFDGKTMKKEGILLYNFSYIDYCVTYDCQNFIFLAIIHLVCSNEHNKETLCLSVIDNMNLSHW